MKRATSIARRAWILGLAATVAMLLGAGERFAAASRHAEACPAGRLADGEAAEIAVDGDAVPVGIGAVVMFVPRAANAADTVLRVGNRPPAPLWSGDAPVAPCALPGGIAAAAVFDGARFRLVTATTELPVTWFGADPTTAADSADAFRLWFAAVKRLHRPGAIPAGRYRLSSPLRFDLSDDKNCGTIHGDGMYRSILDFQDPRGPVTASPNLLIYGSATPFADTNYCSFRDFAVSGSLDGVVLQLGRDDLPAVDAIDSFNFTNIWVSNSDAAHGDAAVGWRLNNVVSSTFQNVVADALAVPITVPVTDLRGEGPDSIRVTTPATAALRTGMTVEVTGARGTSEANGTWPIRVVDATHFDLLTVRFTHPYAGGGAALGYRGYGSGLECRQCAFDHFVGSFGLADIGIHLTGGSNYGNVFANPDVEIVDNGVVQDSCGGPNTFLGGQWDIRGAGYLVSNRCDTSGLLLFDNINIALQATSLYGGRGIDPQHYRNIQFRGYYGDGPQIVPVPASGAWLVNASGQTQAYAVSGGEVTGIDYRGPNAGSQAVRLGVTTGTVLVPPGGAIACAYRSAPRIVAVPQT